MMSSSAASRPSIRQSAINWLTRHETVANQQITLHHRRIYIVPAVFGYYYAATLMLMMLAAMNYNNNMAFLISFLLAGVGGIAMWHTHRNLLNLSIFKPSARPVHAGKDVEFELRIANPTRQTRHALEIGWRRKSTDCVSVAANGSTYAILRIPAQRRGYLRPGRFVVSTRFPFGLFHAWSWLEFNTHTLVYPKPIENHTPPIMTGETDQQGNLQNDLAGCDDYSGLREYRHGDSPRHIAWKVLPRSQQLSTKQFSGETAQEICLQYDAIDITDTEKRLSILCYWVLEFQTTGIRYALRLPDQYIPAGSGITHTETCLRSLALFGNETHGR